MELVKGNAFLWSDKKAVKFEVGRIYYQYPPRSMIAYQTVVFAECIKRTDKFLTFRIGDTVKRCMIAYDGFNERATFKLGTITVTLLANLVKDEDLLNEKIKERGCAEA